MTTMNACFFDNATGEYVHLEAETIEEIAAQLPEGYQGQIRVVNEPGFTVGWVYSQGEWRAS